MNENKIRQLKPNKSISDTVIRGLQCRAYANGRRVFMFYYLSPDGTQRRPTIGDFPALSLADARTLAKALYIRVAIGEDPKFEQDKKRQELSIRDLFAVVWDKHWNTERYQKSRWAKEVFMYSKHILEQFGDLKPSQISRLSVMEWHEDLQKRSVYTANRSLEVMSKMFEYAISRMLTHVATNPCHRVPHAVEKKRNRYASKTEIQTLCEVLKREEPKNPIGVAFILTLLFSGSRPSAIERAKRSELEEFETTKGLAGVLRSSGKGSSDSGEDEVTVLHPSIMALIQVIPTPLDGTLFGIKTPSALWARIRKDAGCEDLWLRDLRRTFATTALSSGVSGSIVGELLNHASIQTTKRYAKLGLEERMDATSIVADVYQGLQQASNAELIK